MSTRFAWWLTFTLTYERLQHSADPVNPLLLFWRTPWYNLLGIPRWGADSITWASMGGYSSQKLIKLTVPDQCGSGVCQWAPRRWWRDVKRSRWHYIKFYLKTLETGRVCLETIWKNSSSRFSTKMLPISIVHKFLFRCKLDCVPTYTEMIAVQRFISRWSL